LDIKEVGIRSGLHGRIIFQFKNIKTLGFLENTLPTIDSEKRKVKDFFSFSSKVFGQTYMAVLKSYFKYF
jgi:hypothetical protein